MTNIAPLVIIKILDPFHGQYRLKRHGSYWNKS